MDLSAEHNKLNIMQSSKPYRILVVDDVLDNLFLLQAVLEAEGYAVESLRVVLLLSLPLPRLHRTWCCSM